MPSLSVLASFVLFAASSNALFQSPVKKINLSPGSRLESSHANRAHARSMGSDSASATNLNYVTYVTSIGIGDPATYYNLVLATGSSNTICGFHKKYLHTKTAIPTGQQISDQYGSGSFEGLQYLDQVALTPHLVITNQSVGDAVKYSGFEGHNGILGLGPADLSQGSLHPAVDAIVPTVMDNAVSQGLIEHNIFGISFAPPTMENETNGVITYGGVDPSAYIGDITYVPLTTTSPSSIFWGINATYIRYGDDTVISGSTAGIVDVGTTQVLFGDALFSAYTKAIPGAKLDKESGLLEIPESSISKLRPLTFDIGGRPFTVDAGSQVVPTTENNAWGGDPEKHYSIVGSLGLDVGDGMNFVLGASFLERFYAVFDAENSRMGFAYTIHSYYE